MTFYTLYFNKKIALIFLAVLTSHLTSPATKAMKDMIVEYPAQQYAGPKMSKKFEVEYMDIEDNRVKKDPTAIFQETKRLADLGSIDAQCNVARLYWKGKGVTEDKTQAFNYYMCAAKQGDLEALCNIGLMYSHGNGVMQDHHQAFAYSKLAADKGFAKAQYAVGIIYFYGLGVEIDMIESTKYLQLAAKQGYMGLYPGLPHEKFYSRALRILSKVFSSQAQSFLSPLIDWPFSQPLCSKFNAI